MSSQRTKKRRQRRRRQSQQRVVWALLAVAALILVGALLLLRPQGNDTYSVPANYEAEVEGAPRLAMLTDEVVDYGEVKLDTTVETVFRVKNVGDQVLRFQEQPYVELVEGC